MEVRRLIRSGMMVCAAGVVCVAVAFCADPPEAGTASTNGLTPTSPAPEAADGRVSVAVARDRAKVMHDVYSATLGTLHHRYFHGDRATVPARAMEDVFAELKRNSKVESRWISVNTKAMSLDHDPKTDFEKRAAQEISDGKLEVEVVEDGYYRRVGAIPLGGGCLSCHEGLFRSTAKVQRFAGLVISVPVQATPLESTKSK